MGESKGRVRKGKGRGGYASEHLGIELTHYFGIVARLCPCCHQFQSHQYIHLHHQFGEVVLS